MKKSKRRIVKKKKNLSTERMRVAVDSSETFSGFEESMTKRPIHTDQHHSELAFHRFSLLREKQILTDAVIFSNDGKRSAHILLNVILLLL